MTLKKRHLAIIFILALAAFFRFWKFASLHPGLYPDEAMNGNDALDSLASGDFKLFYTNNNGREGLFIWLVGLSIRIFGITIWSPRVFSAVFGVLAVWGVYLLTKELFNRRIGLIAGFLLAVSFWHVNFSRISFRAIMVPFLMTFAFYFLIKGLKYISFKNENYPASQPDFFEYGGVLETNKRAKSEGSPMELSDNNRKATLEGHPPDEASIYLSKTEHNSKKSGWLAGLISFILAGIFFGAGFYTYIAFRIAVLVLAALIILKLIEYFAINRPELNLSWWWKKMLISDSWWKIILFLSVVFIVSLPIGLYFLNNFGDFVGRSGNVSVFSASNPLKELAWSGLKTLGMFNIYGDANWRHNYSGAPELDWFSGIGFILGFILIIKYGFKGIWNLLIRKEVEFSQSDFFEYSGVLKTNKQTFSFLFLIIWFFFMLLPAILTNEGVPHALRAIGAIPAVYIISALGLYWLYDLLKTKYCQNNAKFILLIFLIGSAGFNFYQYFYKWANNPNVPGAFRADLAELADYLNDLPTDTQKYFIVNEDGVLVPLSDGIPMPAQTVIFLTRGKTQITYLKPGELDQIKINNQPAVIVLMKYDQDVLNQLSVKLPGARIAQKNSSRILTVD